MVPGTNYFRAFQVMQILQYSIEAIKWQAVLKCHNHENYGREIDHITLFQEQMINKDPETCKELLKKHYGKIASPKIHNALSFLENHYQSKNKTQET